MGYTNTCSIIKWWDLITDHVSYCTSAQFIETDYESLDGNTAPGCLLHHNKRILHKDIPTISLDISDNPILDSKPMSISTLTLPPIGIKLHFFEYTTI